MNKKLSEISDIYLGQPIREKIENKDSGEFFIVQMKDVSRDSGVNVKSLYRTNLKGRVGPRIVKKGDLLFVSRVFRESLPYSVFVNADIPNLIAAPTFTILSVDNKIILPEYLHWFINSESHGGKFFKRNAMGSSVLNIPKNVLSEIDIFVPPMEVQKKLVKLIQATNREKEIMKALSEKRMALNEALLNNFIN
tara:strand:- start:12 stop:593 length:582 start_codon:yes stop_codon:yes gene_type:complete